jgi:electron transport complex protein RnfC
MTAETPATFPKGGIHPPEFKELTSHLPVETMPVPARVELFLKQHAGAPCEPLVKKGDRVTEGDLIARVEKGLGANLHASVSGTVKRIGTAPHPMTGRAPAIVISADPDAGPKSYRPADWRGFSKEQLLARIKDGGVVGLGGAGFPAGVKLTLGPDVRVDTLILNGAECEPYLTSDHRVMVEHPRDVIEGAEIILKILGLDYCVIAVENNKADAIEILNKALAQGPCKNGFRIVVSPLKVKYPQGAADQLIQSVTGRVRPAGARSSAIGVMVQNVYTAKAIHDAVALGRPFYERVITVSGKGIARQANLKVRVGTALGDMAEYLGGTLPDLAKMVVGGPLMGYAVSSPHVPISKTTSGVLFLTQDEVDLGRHSPCIRCGFCLKACPMGLEPNHIGVYVEAGRGAETEQFGIEDCFECGSCAFVCPAKRPLVQFIRLAKIDLSQAKGRQTKR